MYLCYVFAWLKYSAVFPNCYFENIYMFLLLKQYLNHRKKNLQIDFQEALLLVCLF